MKKEQYEMDNGEVKDSTEIFLLRNEEHEIVKKNYYHHAMGAEQIEKIDELKNRFPTMAKAIMHACPNSRERSLALTKLEECMFWANASIARNK